MVPIEFSVVPDGTNNFDVPTTPAMNRWAIIGLSLWDLKMTPQLSVYLWVNLTIHGG